MQNRPQKGLFRQPVPQLTQTGMYSSIRPYLKGEIRERLENPRELHLEVDNRTGDDLTFRGQSPSSVKALLLDEVTRLEQKWKLS